MEKRSVPELEFMLQGMKDLAKATNFYKKCLRDEGFEEDEAMVFVQSWHNYVLPTLIETHLSD